RWLNEKYIHELDYGRLAEELRAWRLGPDYLERVLPLVRERIKQLADFVPATEFFFTAELDYAPVAGSLEIPEVSGRDLRKALLELIDRLDQLPAFSAAALEEASRALSAERGWKTKHLFLVLRLAVTGRKASPPLFDTME